MLPDNKFKGKSLVMLQCLTTVCVLQVLFMKIMMLAGVIEDRAVLAIIFTSASTYSRIDVVSDSYASSGILLGGFYSPA